MQPGSVAQRVLCTRCKIQVCAMLQIEQGGDAMSRRRSKNPTSAISITLPRSMLDKIDADLSYTDSRSHWIASACAARLAQSTFDLPDKRVFAAAFARLPDGVLKDLLLEHLISLGPSEEP